MWIMVVVSIMSILALLVACNENNVFFGLLATTRGLGLALK